MTRLRKEDVQGIGRNLRAYDRHLVRMTGLTLKGIGIRAAGLSEKVLEKALSKMKVSVVPTTCGHGIVEGFAESVRDILTYMGASVFQSRVEDVAGIAEAAEDGADLIFCADDQRFIALHLPFKRLIDNAEATARGYVEALRCVVGSLTNRKVLVIGGAGRVGGHAICALKDMGADVSVYDSDRKRLAPFIKKKNVSVESDLEEALARHDILLDASPATDIIRPEHIGESTVVAAPGIPIGLTEGAYVLVKDRLIHDPLQIGVATMLTMAIARQRKRRGVDRRDRCRL